MASSASDVRHFTSTWYLSLLRNESDGLFNGRPLWTLDSLKNPFVHQATNLCCPTNIRFRVFFVKDRDIENPHLQSLSCRGPWEDMRQWDPLPLLTELHALKLAFVCTPPSSSSPSSQTHCLPSRDVPIDFFPISNHHTWCLVRNPIPGTCDEQNLY